MILAFKLYIWVKTQKEHLTLTQSHYEGDMEITLVFEQINVTYMFILLFKLLFSVINNTDSFIV